MNVAPLGFLLLSLLLFSLAPLELVLLQGHLVFDVLVELNFLWVLVIKQLFLIQHLHQSNSFVLDKLSLDVRILTIILTVARLGVSCDRFGLQIGKPVLLFGHGSEILFVIQISLR